MLIKGISLRKMSEEEEEKEEAGRPFLTTTTTATKAPCQIREAPSLTTGNGIVIGRHLKRGVKVFYHIPFAWAQERFKIAVPPEVWVEQLVLNLSVSENLGTYSRQWCLTLVAYLVEFDNTVYRPCLLWMHGGWFLTGDSLQHGLTSGEFFAGVHAVIVLSVQ